MGLYQINSKLCYKSINKIKSLFNSYSIKKTDILKKIEMHIKYNK